MKSTNSGNNSQKVASILYDIGAVIFRPKQPFKYDSGILSPVYTDNRLIISHPAQREKIVNLLVSKIRQIGIPDAVAGTATAGIPHAAFIAQKLKIPMVYVRSQPKDHGKGNQVEGVIRRGQKVIVVEDLISTAGSSVRVIEALRKQGAVVKDEVAIFTYNLEEARDNLKKVRVKLHALTNLEESAKLAVKKGYLKKDQVDLVLSWSKDPRNWGKKKAAHLTGEFKAIEPAYYVHKSWEYNYKKGPNIRDAYPPAPKQRKWKFLGHTLISPLGVAAGPLPNAKWMIPYLKLGYGSVVQKTVRSSAHKSHPAPNITFIKKGQKLNLDEKPITVETKINANTQNLSITNSFGNPCKEPKEWMREGKKTKKATGAGQLFGISVYGTSHEGMTLDELAQDYAKTAQMAKKAGAQFIEANLACPNVSGAEDPFLYKDAKAVSAISKAMKAKIGKTPLVLKVGYFENYKDLLNVLKKSKGHFEAISAINTIQKKVVDEKGRQALPGRDVSGVCGKMIKVYALDSIKKLKRAQNDLKFKFEIIGVGGVMTPEDVNDFLKAGANHVHSATAVMFNPYLAWDFSKAAKI